MKIEIFAPIIGSILGSLIAAYTSIRVAKIQKPFENKKTSESHIAVLSTYAPPPQKTNLRLNIIFLMLGAFVGGLLGYLVSICVNPPPSTITLVATLTPTPCSFHSKISTRHAFPTSDLIGNITSPNHCETGLLSSIYSPITVEGTIGQIPYNTHSWLFVYSPDGKYYPQCNNKPASKAECTISGEWSMRAYLGYECKPYFLVLISTDNDGSKFLLHTMNIWEKSGDYVGLTSEELRPYEIKELYSIQIETGVCAAQTLAP